MYFLQRNDDEEEEELVDADKTLACVKFISAGNVITSSLLFFEEEELVGLILAWLLYDL